MPNARKIFKDVVIGILLLAVYVIAGKLGLKLAFVNASASAVWPPTGIALAALLILGYRFWPVILLGAFLVNFTTSGGIITSIAIAVGNTLESVIGAFLVKRFASGAKAFERPQDIFKFVFFGALIATAVSASIGVATLVFGNLATVSQIGQIWVTWWLGDISGALIVAPFLILLSSSVHSKIKTKKIIEAIIFLSVFISISIIVFGGVTIFGSKNNPLDFLFIPLMLWAVFSFKKSEVSSVIIILSSLAIWGTLHGFGPFIRSNPNESLLFLQAFLMIASIGSLIVSALMGVEEKLESRFKGLIENSNDVISLIDSGTNILYTSPSTKKVLGYSQQEFLGLKGLSLVEGQDQKRIAGLLGGLLNKPGEVITLQTRIKRKDGKLIWVEATVSNLLNEPSVSAIVVNYRDVTQSKQLEENLIAYNQQLGEEKAKAEALLASIGEGIIATDESGNIILVNKAFEELLGIKAKDAVGKTTIKILPMQDETEKAVPEEQRPLNLAFASGKKITAGHFLVRKDKTKFFAAIIATPLILNGKTVGAIELFRDVTKEKQIDRAKSEFVSLASHQLRTPLTVIKWFASLLLEEAFEERKSPDVYKGYVANIYKTSQQMIELVNAILNVSKIDLGTLAIEPQPTSLVELANSLLEEFEPEINKKHLKLIKSYAGKLPLVNLDPKLTRIVLQNLLTNAIKYTPPQGKISVKIEQSKSEVVFTVEDTGCGILPEDQKKIFGKFFRTEMARQIDPSGNGLGMYIVKAIMKETNGKIWFESKVGKGSKFYVKIPLSGMPKKEGARDLFESYS